LDYDDVQRVSYPLLVGVKEDSPFNTMDDLIAYAKGNPASSTGRQQTHWQYQYYASP
jgi:tripartite-type tricarboxylate transporter receptor subunit TctC